MAARIFTAEATYTLPANTDKRYRIRPHFYPATYVSLDPDNAYFDVIASGVRLLKNFSISEISRALTEAYIVKRVLSCASKF